MKRITGVTLIFISTIFNVFSEGSKNLTPAFGTGDGTTTNQFIGYLCHDQEANITGNFLNAAATSDERLYVHVKQNETLYMGFHRMVPVTNFVIGAGNFGNATLTLRENDGTLVNNYTLTADVTSTNDALFTTPQTGVIDTYAEALAGPAAVVGVSGYSAISYTNITGSDQDFYISLVEVSGAEESWYDLWDISVYDGTEEKPGRLHSKNWGFSAGSFANEFSSDFQMYAQIPSTIGGVGAGNYIKEIDLAGIQPYTTAVFANSTGADIGSTTDLNSDGTIDFLDARRSQGSNIASLEYDLFINNPDIEIYPTSTLPNVTIADAVFYCNSAGTGGEGTIAFNTNQTGIVSIIVDLDGNTGYTAGTEDVIIEQEVTVTGDQVVRWDGLDGLGATVASNTNIRITGRFTSGPVHIPLYDAEINAVGIQMLDTRPTTSFDLIYWDDRSQVGAGSSPTSELSGSNSDQHTWTDGNGILINTWSFGYYQVNSQNVTFSYTCDADGDGVNNGSDSDSDNDGLSDASEGDYLNDTDADNVPDYVDTDLAGFVDSNGDGINDNFDTDLDGVPNALDVDSDNDGIPDMIENGLTDADNDGEVDSFTDLNGNGIHDTYDPACDGSVDTNTYVASQTNTGVGNPANAIGNTPGTFAQLGNNDDITLNFGITMASGTQITFTLSDLIGAINGVANITQSPDDVSYTNTQTYTATVQDPTTEAFVYTLVGDAQYINIDRTGGTVAVYVGDHFAPGQNCGTGTAISPPNTDSDGLDNYLDLDSDNDGIVDVIEAGGTAGTDGRIASFIDSDGNGRNDAQEIAALSIPDTDADGALPNYLDIDSDNDGITDNVEGQASTSYIATAAGDTDSNGLLDVYDPNNGGTLITPVDTDGDSSEDYFDTDADGDGVLDVIEGHDGNSDGFGDWDATGSNNDITDETGYNIDTDTDGLWDIFDTDNGGTAAVTQNTDGSGLSDWQDTDDDDDGSLTSGEDVNSNNDWTDDQTQGQGGSVPDYLYRGDYDGDAIADANDADSDNDGITDATEDNGETIDPSGDEDADGIPNYRDASDATVTSGLSSTVDSNSDGVYDVYDSDLDGVPDFLDLDSDNDGILDGIEANDGSVPFGFNILTGQFDLQDPDNDGLMNYVDTDDVTSAGVSDLANSDSDGDGVSDYLDIDSDRDGIVDNIESQTTGAYVALANSDNDGDGIDDSYDPNDGGSLITPTNTDALDLVDYLDTDSDNDGVLDIIEGDDTNSDGFGDWDTDSDNDITDETNYNVDTDGDGLDDIFDTVTLGTAGNETGSNANIQNTDGTDALDWRDMNDDNDSALTSAEDANTNGDWTDDQTQGQGVGVNVPDYLFNDDNDEDGIVDASDLDSDNDGILDSEEDNGESIDPSGDEDTDGIPNYRDQSDATVTSGLSATTDSNSDGVYDVFDSDLDGVPDFQDLDSDNDGIPDIIESGGVDTDGDGEVDSATDTDNDGLADTFDSDNGGTALTITDVDGDGSRDAIDLDSDDDGIPDISEVGGTDSDGDGEVDDTTDTDSDGLVDLIDADNGGTALTITDADSDGNDDYKDVDSDNDGMTDTIENGGTDSDNNGKIDTFSTDTDGDGLADVVDPDNGGTALGVGDADADGIPNFRDLDSDNDGYQDLLEGGGTDADNDGVLDTMLDSDSDGIPDTADVDIIGGGDTDGDGISDTADVDQTGGNDTDGDSIDNNFDPDIDGNGFDDATEATPLDALDSDNDGNNNFFDIDSDDDGIPDVTEFGGLTTNTSNAQISGFTDVDSNGWNDAQDGNQSGTVITPINSDSSTDPENIPDYLDLDSDDDGIVDNIEAQTKATYISPSKTVVDTDDDGLDDVYDPDNGGSILTPVNTDAVGNEDYLDADSDADTVNDNVEGDNADKNQYADWDANTNATFDDSGFNTDFDDDGILDIFDSFSSTGKSQITGSNSAVQDTDNDGIWDFQDVDDDNDGTNTITDGNADGDPTNDFNDDPATIIPDYLYGDPDHDGDGINDTPDTDSDNDGLADTSEDGSTGIDPSGDIDSDGLLNYQDPDIDGDGTLNTIDTNGDGNGTNTTGFTDTNADGVIDNFDKDLDGTPDFRDLDSDNDGIMDLVELAQTDADNNGIVDGFTDVSGGGAVTSYTISTGCSTTLESTAGHTTGPTGDDANVNPSLPFDFDFYGTTFSALTTTTLNSNGWFSLDNINPGTSWTAVTLPNGTFTNTIFMNHRDHTPNIGGTIVYGTNGSGANEIFVVTFTSVTFFNGGGTSTTQLQLHETTNEIRIITTLFNPDTGENTTMGLNVDGTTSDVVTGRNAAQYTISTAECQSFIPNGSSPNGRDDTIDLSPLVASDTDSDGIDDLHDLDSDNDGLTDNREAQTTAAYIAPAPGDTDTDGVLDVYDANNGGTGITPVNSEGTGSADYLDTDSDDDGVLDNIEGWDANSDGFADWDTDSDNDITDEAGYNTDTDSDGIWFIFDNLQGLGQIANIDGSNQDLQDTDADATVDFRDQDDDADGSNTNTTGASGEDANTNSNWADDFTQGGGSVPNYLYNPDVDGDGIADQTDADSDNDGVLNSDEYTGAVYASSGTPFSDADGDGIYNYLDTNDVNNTSFVDSNGDGVDDQVDQDMDGVPNFFDLDSDNDGILDAIEANDGAVHADLSTTTGRFTTGDTDGDGLVNSVDTDNGGTALNKDDLDSDGLDDYLDLDTDNDGLTDNVEGQATTTAPSGTDTDGDGWDDNYDADNGGTAISPVNTDGTDEPDYRDTNSDNDTDGIGEVGDIIEGFDANRNGFSDLDTDLDGLLSDQSGYNTDTDGDGLWDLFDNFSGSGTANINGSNANLQDTDGDGTLDYRDTDDDDDNISTAVEDVDSDGDWTNDKVQGGGATPDYLFFNDSDKDLVADGQDVDGDNDGIPNDSEYDNTTYRDPFGDQDTDGVFNYNDSDDPTDLVGGALTDSNADGIWDEYDLDLDGVPNFFDLDSDNDGIPDIVEAGGTDVDGDGQLDGLTDSDNDGLLDTYDVDATMGTDSDGDGIDDAFDRSVVGSGTDADGDDVLDTVDRDDDGDGVVDIVDTDEGGTALTIPDTDSDTIVDMWDLDTDNDGIVDLVEGGGSDSNGDGQLDGFGDTDGDGYGNTVDADNGGTALTIPNTDSAGNPNYMDQDSDGDGSLDYDEGFDDDEDGDATSAGEDYEARATAYGNALEYDPSDLSWLTDFRTFGSGNYYDADGDGIINLYDTDAGGNFYGNVSGAPNNDSGTGDVLENYVDANDAGLPLDFLSFSGYFDNGVVHLNWRTANEVNVSHFVVEHAVDGETFSKIGELKAINIETLINNYEFTHSKPISGFNYYRVTEIDFDGLFESSKVISVFGADNQLKFELYPNPTRNMINIRSSAGVPVIILRIVDLNGAILHNDVLRDTGINIDHQIDISHLNSGMYQLLMQVEGKLFQHKIIKQ